MVAKMTSTRWNTTVIDTTSIPLSYIVYFSPHFGILLQGRSRQYRQTLYQTLLAVYLTPKDK